MHQHLVYLRQALELATIQQGFCAPNPSVGAVIVDQSNHVIATGYHKGYGLPHAEVDALAKLHYQAPGATLYVTLEPCCHSGKTPPCTDALINSGIKRIVYAFSDPNPIVSGKGAAALLEAGLQCEHVPLSEIDAFYDSYQHWHITKTPIITAKIAQSLNGKIAQLSGDPISLTGSELKKLTHQSRKNADAILTSIATIQADNPQMNARVDGNSIPKPIYILDSQLNLSLTATIFSTTKTITLFHAKQTSSSKVDGLKKMGVRCIEVDSDSNGLDLHQVVQHIGQDGVHNLWVEAGGKCFTSFLTNNLLHRILIYIAPQWIQEGLDAFRVNFNFAPNALRWQQAGSDVFCEVILKEATKRTATCSPE